MRVTFCGVRGSTPAPGPDFLRYGGHTSSIAVAPGDGAPDLVVDAGTGLTAVTALLDGAPFAGSVLLGHLHWDHTHGLPFFAGGTAEGSRVAIHLPEQNDGTGSTAEQVLERCFSPPHFPVVPSALGEGWSFASIDEGEHRVEGYDVLAREIPHKGGRSLGYRISHGGASLAYVSDHSPTSWGPGPDGLGVRHDNALALARGVDVLVHDAQHRAAQFPEVDFLGHASPEYALELAREAGARTLVLFHHAPDRTDDELDEILADTRALARGDVEVLAAYEGLVLDLP